MKYTVKTEKVTPGEHNLEANLPFGAEDVELLDKMVRSQAKEKPAELIALEPGERITEVWREGIRIYPRAIANGRKKPGPKPTTHPVEDFVKENKDA